MSFANKDLQTHVKNILKNLEGKVDRISKQMGYLSREIESKNWKFIKLKLETIELKNSMSEMKINHLGLKED